MVQGRVTWCLFACNGRLSRVDGTLGGDQATGKPQGMCALQDPLRFRIFGQEARGQVAELFKAYRL